MLIQNLGPWKIIQLSFVAVLQKLDMEARFCYGIKKKLKGNFDFLSDNSDPPSKKSELSGKKLQWPLFFIPGRKQKTIARR